jgi:hypothetical protein
MSQIRIEQQIGQRFLVNLPVRAEWDEERTGRHIVAEGETEHIGPTGAMVTLEQLPSVGSRIRLSIKGADGPQFESEAEVVRLVRDLAQPLASLSILKSKSQKEWRGRVWEPAAEQAARQRTGDGETDEDGSVN